MVLGLVAWGHGQGLHLGSDRVVLDLAHGQAVEWLHLGFEIDFAPPPAPPPPCGLVLCVWSVCVGVCRRGEGGVGWGGGAWALGGHALGLAYMRYGPSLSLGLQIWVPGDARHAAQGPKGERGGVGWGGVTRHAAARRTTQYWDRARGATTRGLEALPTTPTVETPNGRETLPTRGIIGGGISRGSSRNHEERDNHEGRAKEGSSVSFLFRGEGCINQGGYLRCGSCRGRRSMNECHGISPPPPSPPPHPPPPPPPISSSRKMQTCICACPRETPIRGAIPFHSFVDSSSSHSFGLLESIFLLPVSRPSYLPTYLACPTAATRGPCLPSQHSRGWRQRAVA